MKKKIITIICFLSLILVLNIASNVSAVTLSIPDMHVSPGSNIEIPIMVDNAAGIAALEYVVGYDPAVLNCTEEANGDLTSEWGEGGTKQYKSQIRGIKRGVKNGDPLPPLTATSGSLSKLQCNVIGDIGSQTKVCLQIGSIFDEWGDKIPSTRGDCVDLKVVGTVSDLYAFFKDAVDSGSIVGIGPNPMSAAGRLGAFGNMLEEAEDLFDSGKIKKACKQLLDALGKTDGLTPPPDFVDGPAITELVMLIQGLIDSLECE